MFALRGGTALALLLATFGTAIASGGDGGNGAGAGGAGGAGGSDSSNGTGGTGGNGSPDAGGGGGGGGGGAGGIASGGLGGGNGGTGSGGAAGGARSTSAAFAGGNGTGGAAAGDGGGGGGGGFTSQHSAVSSVTAFFNFTSSAGGQGGAGNGTGGGGGGGSGGWDASLVNNTTYTINAGVQRIGGQGGAGGASAAGTGGNGGFGGHGARFLSGGTVILQSGSLLNAGAGGIGGNGTTGGNGGTGGFAVVGDNLQIINNGTIAGGNGGVRGTGATNGAHGAGGIGIVGQNLTITNNGTISGGVAGDGVSRSNAIVFTGGTNFINFGGATSNLTGGVTIGGGTVQLNAAVGATTVNDVFSGAGGLIFNTTNTLTLAAANTNTGATNLISGTVALDNLAAFGTGNVNFTGGTLRTNVSGTLNENLIVLNGGVMHIVAANGTSLQVDGAISTQANASAIRFGEAGNTATIALVGTTVINNPPVFSLDVLGGTLTTNAGFAQLGALSAAAATTNVAAGAVLDFASGASASVRNLQSAGTVNRNTGFLTIGGGQSSGAITGAAGLIVAAPGTFGSGGNTGSLILSGTNTYTGNTTIQSGASLTLGAGGTTGSILGNVANSGTFAFNRSNAYTFAGLISGTGSVQQNGTGTTTLSAINTYTGATTVNAGTLAIASGGSIVSNTTVNGGTFQVNGTAAGVTVNGGTLGGAGSVGTTTFNGGTLAPGNSIGTLTFNGNLALSSATTYMVEVDPNGADRTNVTGTASLGGARVSAIYANGSYVTRSYTILNAQGGVSGTFNALVNTNLPASFTPSLRYDANNAYLDLTLNFTPAPTPPTPTPTPTPTPPPTAPTFVPLTVNQTNVANALVNSFNTAGGIPLVFGALTRDGLTAVSGEHATGTQQTTFDAMDKFVNVMTDPFMGTRAGGSPQAAASGYADEDGSLAYAAKRKRTGAEREAYAAFKAPPKAVPFERRWSVWGAGYGGTQQTDGDGVVGSQKFTNHVYGGAAGFDYRLTPETMVGFALGGAGTTFGLTNGLGGGRSEVFQAGLYGRHTSGPAYVSGAVAWGWQDITTNRTIFANGYRANFDANAITGRLEGGWRFAYGTSGITPYAAGQVTGFFLPGYAETLVAGVNTFALAYSGKDVTASRTELGLRGDTSFTAVDAIVTLRGRAAWAHNFNTDRSISAIFQTLPASGFTVFGASPSQNSALVSAGAEAKWLNGISLAATFEGEFSNRTESYAGKGTLRYQW